MLEYFKDRKLRLHPQLAIKEKYLILVSKN
jgi:hypothetical protein